MWGYVSKARTTFHADQPVNVVDQVTHIFADVLLPPYYYSPIIKCSVALDDIFTIFCDRNCKVDFDQIIELQFIFKITAIPPPKSSQ